MEREKLVELWKAANTHSVIMCGEYLVEYYGDHYPTAPGDAEIIEKVTEYFKEIV